MVRVPYPKGPNVNNIRMKTGHVTAAYGDEQPASREWFCRMFIKETLMLRADAISDASTDHNETITVRLHLCSCTSDSLTVTCGPCDADASFLNVHTFTMVNEAGLRILQMSPGSCQIMLVLTSSGRTLRCHRVAHGRCMTQYEAS